MGLNARWLFVVGVLALAVAGLGAQQGAGAGPQGGGPGGGGGRGGGIRGQGQGQGPGPLIDPAQLPGPGGRGGRFGAPPRDDQTTPQGTAKITGRIVSAETGNPLRRAQIRLTAPEIRANRVATSDNNGRYEFTGLAAARYRLQISKAGYVTLEYGQARPFEAGKPLDVVDGQALEKIDFSLPRGSVIAGRVTDEFGDPVADATLQAMRYQFVNGQRQLVNAGRASTSDDIGQFRIFGLMPGDYVVRASVRDGAIASALVGVEEPSGYPVTYYPGTTDVGQAQPVTVALGQELNSVFFPLVPARLARISGTVLDSQGHALSGAVVVVRPATGGGAGGAFNIGGGNQVRADGSFTLNSVPPGEYTLDIQQRPRNLQSLGTDQLEFASIPLSVAGTDISGLTIITTPGVTVAGRVVLQGQKEQTTPLRGLQVGTAAPSGAQSLLGIAGRALGGGRVNDDGTFQLRGLAGQQMIRVGNVPAGWAVKSITLEGEDITDAPFDFKSGGGDLTGLTVTLTDKLTDLSGTVLDNRRQAVKDYVLVIFPDDNKLGGGQSRYVRTARPNQDGNFSVKGLPPAHYLAVAVQSLETGTQNDPAVLEQLRPRAKSFALTEGQTLTLSLEMSAAQ
jgi:protocatechuate 3,4-dioxygenase beta subunit